MPDSGGESLSTWGPLRGVFQFPIACGSCGYELRWFSKLDIGGCHLSGAGLKSWGARCGVQILRSLREKLWVLSSLQIMGHCAGGGFYGETVSKPKPPLLASMWVFSHLPSG